MNTERNKRDAFGTEPLGSLLRQQAVPASIGFLVISIYGIVDTIFVGRFVGANGIGAITVVLPITFLIASIGMAIGIGGASIISRAFGEQNEEKAFRTFGNQIGLTLTLAIGIATIGYVFIDDILNLFGGKGDILNPAREYFSIIIIGIPFLAWAMMSNNVIRAEGFPKVAMVTLIVPAVLNTLLDPVFIIWLDMGMAGAAWATTISYMGSALYTTSFFLFGKSNMELNWHALKPSEPIVREMAAIGSVTLARQGTISILSIVVNNTLFAYGGELALSVYGIIHRSMMFMNFPVIGITQGFVPIVGYNYGAKLWDRVDRIINLAVHSATGIALCIFTIIMIFTPQITSIFSNDPELIRASVPAMRYVFLATPLIAINFIGSAYFQAIGKARSALVLALAKQGYLLIPLVLLLPLIFGLNGVWYAFAIADSGAAIITFLYLRYHKVHLELPDFKRMIAGNSGT